MPAITEAAIKGAYFIDVEPHTDDRGFFGRLWDATDFDALGLRTDISQCSISHNVRRNTLRGLHMQIEPFGEAKYVRCTHGRLFDVAVDLRSSSPTYMRWTSTELSRDNRRMFYIPPGCAHGFLTLQDDTEVFYMIAGRYEPASAITIRWDDPQFGIEWPVRDALSISRKDADAAPWHPSRSSKD